MSIHRASHRAILLGLSGTLAAALLLSGCTGDDEGEPVISGAATATATASEDGSVPTASPFPTNPATAEGSPTPASTADATSTPEEPTGESSQTTGEATAEDAVAVLDQYFSAIGTGDYEAAYGLWRNDGEASGQTFEEFVTGFDATASVSWDIGEPGRIEPGAGQRYIEIPARITARTTDGEAQRFEGVYVLHHTADIPGATEEQRLWRIDSADVSEAE